METNLNQSEKRLDSIAFPGHYYEKLEKIGEGGMGTVVLVVLRESRTGRYRGIYACKIIYEHFLKKKNEEMRRKNLAREIELLKAANKKTCVTLVDLIVDEERTILIQDYANGFSLNRLLGERKAPLRESEIQKIVKKLTAGLDDIY